MPPLYADGRVEVREGDITELEVDVIVNAANESLLGGGGVDGAIHRGAGPRLLEACRALGGCDTGDAKVTEGFGLPARWVIHAVGPRWHGGDENEAELLEGAYRRSLELADKLGAATIAFPAISTGAYGYPLEEATEIAVTTVVRFLAEHDAPGRVVFCPFSEGDKEVYERVCGERLG